MPHLQFLTLLFLAAAESAFAQAPASGIPVRAEFDVASVKLDKNCPRNNPNGGPPAPGHITMNCTTVKTLIQSAYGALANGKTLDLSNIPNITGGPSWMESEFYDVNAKTDHPVPVAEMAGPMLQALLEDRFQLKLHHDTKEGSVYLLTVAKGGHKLQPAKGDCEPFDLDHLPSQPKPGEPAPSFCGMPRNLNRQTPGKAFQPGMKFEVKSGALDFFSGFLRSFVDRPIINRTGIDGKYDFMIEFVPEGRRPPPPRPGSGDLGPAPQSDPGGPDIFEALQHQLGLTLEKGKGPVDMIVIDHLERPSEN